MRHQTTGMWVNIILVTFVFLAPALGRADAETVLEKISRTGKLTAGTRTTSVPFAYVNQKKEWVGFSVDIIKEVHQRLNRTLVKEISLDLKEVNPRNRVQLVADGAIDIECGSTTYTRSRDETVDFSINFFYTGSQLLVKKESLITGLRDVAGKRVGVTQGTTNEKILRLKQPQARMVLFKDHDEAFEALQQGKIDAYATDGILLAGLVAKSPSPDGYEVVDFFSSEPYSCILPENDSRWRDFVNHTIMELIESRRYFEIYERWFGEGGIVRYEMPAWVRIYLLLQVMPQ